MTRGALETFGCEAAIVVGVFLREQIAPSLCHALIRCSNSHHTVPSNQGEIAAPKVLTYASGQQVCTRLRTGVQW
jgi:hypothetical protein